MELQVLQSSKRGAVRLGSRTGNPYGHFQPEGGIAFMLLNLKELDVCVSDQK